MNATEDPDVFVREGRTYNGSDGTPEAPRFTLVPFKSLTPRNVRRYLIKHIFPRAGLILVWGPPKCGKSFWTFDAVMHIALGWEYRGRRVHQGPVVYCAFEGAEGFKARAEAFRQQHGLEGREPPFHLISAAMDLVKDRPELVASIRAQIGDVMPAVVVLDTLNRSLRGSESSDEDMAEYVRTTDAIQTAFGCALIVVHHCGHDGNRPRGHSALLGAVDAQIAVTRDTSDNIIATVERMKDGPEGDTIASRLEQVEVGIDEDGDLITSCIVVPVEGKAAIPSRKALTLPKSAKIALQAIQEAVEEAGESPTASNHIPGSVRVVTVDMWRQYAYQRGISAADAGERARQQAFKRASEHLVAGGHVGIWGEHVWATQ